tara:strand:- start:819 stop:1037 length:219 start_codon:yes stop_codon:yes gene_type:complete
MDISDSLKDPLSAAIFAACVTIGYIYVKAKMNNEPRPENSAYAKPSLLVGMLVYFIVHSGVAAKETILSEPY